jgi:tRNA guanosine-2'-O-methyltransferase
VGGWVIDAEQFEKNGLMYERYPMALNRQEYHQLPRHSLIICAALVENPMNLGALCRTVEAFRLQSLVLADLGIAQNRKFRQLSAATYGWQPLEECAPDRLLDWLYHQRQQGYAILGLTANRDAAPLHQAKLPQEVVLVLGRELTGIPHEIEQECDLTLTIPQYGMADSLNVQTAAAIAIYEYIRQWGMASA